MHRAVMGGDGGRGSAEEAAARVALLRLGPTRFEVSEEIFHKALRKNLARWQVCETS